MIEGSENNGERGEIAFDFYTGEAGVVIQPDGRHAEVAYQGPRPPIANPEGTVLGRPVRLVMARGSDFEKKLTVLMVQFLADAPAPVEDEQPEPDVEEGFEEDEPEADETA